MQARLPAGSWHVEPSQATRTGSICWAGSSCRPSAGFFVCHQIHLVVRIAPIDFFQPDSSRLGLHNLKNSTCPLIRLLEVVQAIRNRLTGTVLCRRGTTGIVGWWVSRDYFRDSRVGSISGPGQSSGVPLVGRSGFAETDSLAGASGWCWRGLAVGRPSQAISSRDAQIRRDFPRPWRRD